MRPIIVFCTCLILAGCATQRFGRQTPLSETEKTAFDCRDIKIETAKTEEFLTNIKKTRKDTNAAHVVGFLLDFGIGNTWEGDEAEATGEARLKALNDLGRQKAC